MIPLQLTAVFTAAMMGVAALMLILKVEATDERFWRGLYTMELGILIVAFCFYVLIVYRLTIHARPTRGIRYIDWAITTPLMLSALLLVEISDGVDDADSVWGAISSSASHFLGIAACSIAMVFIGFWASMKSRRWVGFFGGLLPLAGALLLVALHRDVSVDNSPAFWYTVTAWILYGLVYITLSGSGEEVAYNVLDFASKPIFAILLSYSGVFKAKLG